MLARNSFSLTALLLTGALATGCGYTSEEYQLQGDKLTRSLAKQRAAETRADEATAELDSAKARIAALEEKMRMLGVDIEQKDTRIGDMTTSLAERERALAEFRARAAKLDETRTRLALLKAKLEELSNVGVEVRIRKNRMVIVLPGDVVFDSNKDKLRKEGRAALLAIAEVIKNDPTLATRDYQVAGHTDNKAIKGGAFGDNMSLSMARAKTVLGVLIGEGGLAKEHFSAAGYGDTDPFASNDNEEGQKKNRRCELVVVPSVAEILDLRQLALEPAPATGVAPPKAPLKTPETKAPSPKEPAKEPSSKEAPKTPAKEAPTKDAPAKEKPKATPSAP